MRDWAVDNRILTVIGGSHAYGLNTPDSDWDYRAVAMPPVTWLLGFPPEDGKWTANIKGDEDTVVHALPKFCRLAMGCNPNIIEMLFCRDEDVVFQDARGKELRSIRDAFLSKRAAKTFGGYAVSQLRRAKNHNSRHGSHGDLIAKHQYDTKNAMHIVRLVRVGLEIAKTGKVNVYRQDAEELLAIRNGAWTYGHVVEYAEGAMRELDEHMETSVLPDDPNTALVEAWLVSTQVEWVERGRVGRRRSVASLLEHHQKRS